MKNIQKPKIKGNEKGITLVALVVTIVILLILAGVSINLVIGNNGIITKAQEAKEQTEQASKNEQTGMDNLSGKMEELLKGNNGESDVEEKLGQVIANEEATLNSTINGEAATATNPIIPAGYTPINVGDAIWGETGAYNEGLVIKDDSGNEWVWVPVPDASVMYETSDIPIELLGDTGITTKKYSKSEVIAGMKREKPGEQNTLPQEPDLMQFYDDDSYAIVAGFDSLVDMAETLVRDYDEMIASIEKYEGFYIGRYELTTDGEKAGETLTDKNWYELYSQCKTLSSSNKVVTRMIWGCQWDVTCNWLADNGYNIDDSTSWGNYQIYNTANNYLEENVKYEAGAGSKQATGSSENWKANNIYDLAGNCLEWTQETSDDDADRASRGGMYDDCDSDFISAKAINSCNSPDSADTFIGTRAVLMINPNK